MLGEKKILLGEKKILLGEKKIQLGEKKILQFNLFGGIFEPTHLSMIY